MINNKDKIDGLFKEALESYKVAPSRGFWNSLETRFFGSGRAGLYYARYVLIAVLIIGIGISIGILYPRVSIDSRQPAVGSQQPVPKSEATRDQQSSVSSPQSPVNSLKSADESRVGENFRTGESKSTGETSFTQDAPNTVNPSVASADNGRWASFGPLSLLPSSTLNLARSYPGLFELRNTNPVPQNDFTIKDNYIQKASMSFGFNLTPAMVFYDPNPNKHAYSAELNARLHLSDFYLESGLGMMYMEDINSYKINYESFDSVGYFLNVISFRIDPQNPDKVLLDYQTEAVFDSVAHYKITQKNSTYTYLQVPLTLGYKFFSSRRISLTASAGVVFSWLVGKYEPAAGYIPSNETLVSIDQEVPTRLKTNWRFRAGIGFNYMMTDKISLSLEPVYEQYIQTVYQDKPGYSAKKPFMIGLRTGILFHF
jgi:hypothetical protein